MTLRVVIIQSEMQSAQPLARYFTLRGDEVWQAWELGQGWALVEQIKPHLILMDLHFTSAEWLTFLRRVRQSFPEVKIIMTNKYPDLQREMLVREQNVQVFLRQPFSAHWIEQALGRLNAETRPVRLPRRKNLLWQGYQTEVNGKEEPGLVTRQVRVPVWLKITAPYLALVGLVALGHWLWAGSGRVSPAVMAAGFAGVILLVILLGQFLGKQITQPLLWLSRAFQQVAQGNLEIKADARGKDETAVLSETFNYMVAGLQEGSIYRDLLGRTVSPEMRAQMRALMRGDFASGNLRLEGQQAAASVLVCHLHGLTSAGGRSDAPVVFQWLNETYDQVQQAVAEHGGVVNQFDGETILAVFGILPRMTPPQQSAADACQAALKILTASERVNRQRAMRGAGSQLLTSISVNTGMVMAGGLGTSDRLQYMILGETVTSARGMGALARDLVGCSSVLVGEATYAALSGQLKGGVLVSLGEQHVQGREDSLSVYRLDRQLGTGKI